MSLLYIPVDTIEAPSLGIYSALTHTHTGRALDMKARALDWKSFQLFSLPPSPPLTSVELVVLCKLLQVIILAVVMCGLEGKSIIFLTRQTYFIQP